MGMCSLPLRLESAFTPFTPWASRHEPSKHADDQTEASLGPGSHPNVSQYGAGVTNAGWWPPPGLAHPGTSPPGWARLTDKKTRASSGRNLFPYPKGP